MGRKVDEVLYSKSAVKFVRSQNPKQQQRIKNAIDAHLMEIPEIGDVKPLKGRSDGVKRLRVGSIRVLYVYSEFDTILVLSIIDVDNRGGIYK